MKLIVLCVLSLAACTSAMADCTPDCIGGYENTGQCLEYGSDYCGPGAVECDQNCTGGYENTGQCLSYGPDYCYTSAKPNQQQQTEAPQTGSAQE